MADVLVCWLGNTDLKAAAGDPAAGLGPIGRAVAARPFDAVHLLSDNPDFRSEPVNQSAARLDCCVAHSLAPRLST